MADNVATFHRSAALVVTLTLFAGPVAAQTLAAQPSLLATPRFAQLVEDHSIVVITTDGQRHEGRFTISGRALVMRDAAVALTVPFEQVARIQKSTFRIRKHALIGLGVGAAVGGLFDAAVCSEGCDGSEWGVLGVVLISGGIGLGTGAGNGAILNARNADNDIVFDTSLRSVSTDLPPSSSRLGTAAFAQLVEGKDVWITTADGTKRRGEVAVVTGNGLILTGSQHALLPFDQVVTIVEVSHRIRNGVVNGLGAGMSVGLLNYFVSNCYDDYASNCGVHFWGYSALGAGAGALVGVLMNRNKDRDLLYDAGRKTTTVSFAPILSPSRQGIAFSMTWR